MKLYLVTRTDRIGYDEYDSWVVRAKDEVGAKALCNWYVSDPPVTVEEIKISGKEEAILGSFNAG